jgi:hypothetical protein
MNSRLKKIHRDGCPQGLGVRISELIGETRRECGVPVKEIPQLARLSTAISVEDCGEWETM